MEFLFHFYALIFFKLQKNGNIFEKIIILPEMKNVFFQRNIFQKSSSVIFDRKFWVWISPSGVKSGGFGAKLQNLKKPWFLGFECQFSGFLQVSVYGFGSGSSSKKVGFYPKDYGIFGFKYPSLLITSTYYLSISNF